MYTSKVYKSESVDSCVCRHLFRVALCKHPRWIYLAHAVCKKGPALHTPPLPVSSPFPPSPPYFSSNTHNDRGISLDLLHFINRGISPSTPSADCIPPHPQWVGPPVTCLSHDLDNVASGPAGPALAGPLFVQETYFLKMKAGQFAHTSRLRGF